MAEARQSTPEALFLRTTPVTGADQTMLNVGSYAPGNHLILTGSGAQIIGGSSGGTMSIGALSGSADAVFDAVATSTFDFKGSMTGFAGTINLSVSGGNFRFNGNNATGSSTATFNL